MEHGEHRRGQLLTSLPLEKLSRLKVEKLTRDIGKDHAVKVEKAAGDEPKDLVGCAVAQRYRMAYKDAVLTRPLAAVLIAATLGLASPGGVLFQCRFDGVVRSACCCEHERSTHEHSAVAQAMAGTCCDLLVRSPVTREAMKADTAPRLANIQPVILPTPTPWPASSVPASVLQLSWTGPSGPGHPLLLQSCSLLI